MWRERKEGEKGGNKILSKIKNILNRGLFFFFFTIRSPGRNKCRAEIEKLWQGT